MDQSHRVCPGNSLELAHRICRPDYTLKGRGGTCDVQFHLGSVYAEGDCLVKVWLEPGVRPSLAWADAQYQVRFSVSGVNLNHAVHVLDSRSVLTQFGINQGPVDQGVNVIRLQDDGLPVVFNGFSKLSKVFVDYS